MEKLPNFRGKIVALYFGPTGDSYGLLEKSKFETQAGRMFLVGTIPQYSRGWGQGLPMAVAWDSVFRYLVFDSLDQYNREVAKCPPENPLRKLFGI